MGQTILRCLDAGAVPGLTLSGAVDLWDSAALHQPANRAGLTVTSDLAKVAPGCDVIVDFSSHHGTAGNAPRIAGWGKAWVIGTTGLSAEEKQAVAEAARTVPVVLAPNMSLGVNLLFALLEQAGRALKDKGYDVEIIERHHRRKKDSPSGTALYLGQAVANGLEADLTQVAVHGREGLSKTDRSTTEIGFHAVRGGDIVGDHTVLFAGTGERIEITHKSSSRATYAQGSLRAVRFLRGKAHGMFDMFDVLGLV